MRRRDSAPTVEDWPVYLAVFDDGRWSEEGTPRHLRWFAWIGARQDWLMAQGVPQDEAGRRAFDTDVLP